jgi:acyl-CoA synthetase (AMP-forming)/AMP-acid ligase II
VRTWTSRSGLVLRDLVPTALRRAWVEDGPCQGVDLYTAFRRTVDTHPGREAVVDQDGVVDYAGLDAQVRRIAAGLVRRGLGFGDVIGIRLPDTRDAVAVELAVWAVGAVALPYPTGHGGKDAASLLGRSRAAALVAAPGADPVAGRPHLRVALTPPPWEGPVPDLDAWSPTPADAESPARILVSSGSESDPKMVVYSHNAFTGGRASYVRALHSGAGPMRNLVLVPLASSMGSCGVPVTVAALGGTLLVAGRFDPATALRVLDGHRPTHVFGVPTMLRRLAGRARPGRPDGLLALVSSGAELPAATAADCRDRFGVPVVTVYGSSDGVNCHTATGPGTGVPDPGVTAIRITDQRGVPVPVGVAGEIQARGPMTPWCYVGDPALDRRYRTEGGWVRSGDRGLLDERGNLHVLGRLRQVVIRGGYNISPAEVEREIGAHPRVADVACVGVPDPDLGERLCACVAQPPGSPPLTLDHLTGFLREHRGLERAKMPEMLVVLPALPVAATGKTCRRSLAELAASTAAGHASTPPLRQRGAPTTPRQTGDGRTSG